MEGGGRGGKTTPSDSNSIHGSKSTTTTTQQGKTYDKNLEDKYSPFFILDRAEAFSLGTVP